MHLKSEFRNRLLRLYFALDVVLSNDNANQAEKCHFLFSRLVSVYSYLLCKSINDLLKK